jgi:nitrogen fixation/metabolism regulation signal transduction histidine kinase
MTAKADVSPVDFADEPASTQRLAALGTLTVPLAQELTGLLGAIASHAERALSSRASPGVDHDLTQVLAAASRARGIVEKLHRFARRGVGVREPLDLGKVVSDGLGLLRLTIPGAIHLQAAIAGELELVMADPMGAHQVLVTLVGGSAERLAPGDTLQVSVEGCNVDEALAARNPALRVGRYVRLGVQGLASTISEARGFGFDLAVVEGILIQHEGALLVDTGRDGARAVSCLFPALRTSGPVNGFR